MGNIKTLEIGACLKSDNIVYRIEEILGQGSFGITYKAKTYILLKGKYGEELVETNKWKAIKEFFMKEINERNEDGSLKGMSEDSLSYNYASKFKKEAESLASMDHPNIVKVIDFISANNTFYYVMDYIEGENLNEYLKHHSMTEQEATDTIVEVAKALQYMHENKRMLHLDLKPGNIMRRNSDGHIFLIDFGLSKHYSEDGIPETSTTIGFGTPGYAPIEQANCKGSNRLKATIDVYSLGATYFKLLTGETPPPASTLVSDDRILDEILESKSISSSVISAVKMAMEPNVNKRTQDINSFLCSINEAFDDSNTATTIEEIPVFETIKINYSQDQEIQNDNSLQNDNKIQNDNEIQNENENNKINKRKFTTYFYVFAVVILIGISIGTILYLKNRRDFTQDYSQELVNAAEKGDKLAQYWLGKCYSKGRGVSIDNQKAFEWYYKSAIQGLDSAQVELSKCYWNGEGVKQNFGEAVKWINQAIEKDNADAYNYLGKYYNYGDGVELDSIKALELYKKSAEKGSYHGMVSLGYAYLYGRGIEADTIKAKQWFEKAEQKKKYSTISYLSEYYQGKYGGERDSLKCINLLLERLNSAKDTMTLQGANVLLARFYELGEGQHQNTEEAIKYYNMAAALGSPEGMYWTGMFNIWGGDLPKNDSVAFYWLNKCANIELPWEGSELKESIRQSKNATYREYCITESQRTVASLYNFGDGVEKNADKYLYWLKKAAYNGSKDAQHGLGHVYMDGNEIISPDIKEAYKWFETAVENKHGEACVDMAFGYFEGREGFEQNNQKGMEYLDLGYSRNDPLATWDLGIIYYYGQYGVDKDLDKSKMYLTKAKELGYEKAENALNDLF